MSGRRRYYGLLVLTLLAAAATVLTAALITGVGVVWLAVLTFGLVALYGVASLRLEATEQLRLEALSLELKRREEELVRQATTDSVTGVHNRRFLDEHLENEFRRAQRYGRALSLIMLDLDLYKEVNDCYGHRFGDVILAQVAQRLPTGLRTSDVVARYGGDEFAVLLPETDRARAVVVAERIRQMVKEQPFSDGHNSVSLTVSQGIASYPGEGIHAADDLLTAADAALYEAKSRGRDQIVLSSRAVTGPS